MAKQSAKGRSVWKYRVLLHELVARDLKVKYRRSFLGYLWSLLNPLLMMAVMSIVFSYMFRSDIENFPLYLICGNTLFAFFSESTTVSMYSILTNSSLIKKVYVPKLIFPLSRVLSSFVTTSFSLVAILIVMLFMRARFFWTILLFWVPLAFLLVFCFGISLVLSSLAVFFRDITHLYSVITMVWMYITPIFYPVNANFLSPTVIKIISCNPLYHYIDFFRSVVMYGTVPDAGRWLMCAVFSLLSVVLGLFAFLKTQDRFILYI